MSIVIFLFSLNIFRMFLTLNNLQLVFLHLTLISTNKKLSYCELIGWHFQKNMPYIFSHAIKLLTSLSDFLFLMSLSVSCFEICFQKSNTRNTFMNYFEVVLCLFLSRGIYTYNQTKTRLWNEFNMLSKLRFC